MTRRRKFGGWRLRAIGSAAGGIAATRRRAWAKAAIACS